MTQKDNLLLHRLNALLVWLSSPTLFSLLFAALPLVGFQVIIQQRCSNISFATLGHEAHKVLVKLCSLPFIALTSDIVFFF